MLISILTALRSGAWTIDQVQGDLQMLFDKQYMLTEDVTTETQYRMETRTGTRTVTGPETGEESEEEYEYDVQVSYTYYICNVKPESLEKRIREQENTDIIGLVRAQGISLEEFAALMRSVKAPAPIPASDETEEPGHEEV